MRLELVLICNDCGRTDHVADYDPSEDYLDYQEVENTIRLGMWSKDENGNPICDECKEYRREHSPVD